jgi:hypothetical protein
MSSKDAATQQVIPPPAKAPGIQTSSLPLSPLENLSFNSYSPVDLAYDVGELPVAKQTEFFLSHYRKDVETRGPVRASGALVDSLYQDLSSIMGVEVEPTIPPPGFVGKQNFEIGTKNYRGTEVAYFSAMCWSKDPYSHDKLSLYEVRFHSGLADRGTAFHFGENHLPVLRIFRRGYELLDPQYVIGSDHGGPGVTVRKVAEELWKSSRGKWADVPPEILKEAKRGGFLVLGSPDSDKPLNMFVKVTRTSSWKYAINISNNTLRDEAVAAVHIPTVPGYFANVFRLEDWL